MNRYLPHLAVLLLAVGLHGAGYLSSIENYLADSRFKIDRAPASGNTVVVEIDSASLRALDSWPWPRRYHAEVLDRLVQGGARVIAMDVDFSARSVPAEDERLADALARAGGKVILPVFTQYASAAAGSGTVINRPFEPFRRHARLAAINIHPDRNGQIRRMALSEEVDGAWLPTLAAALADLVAPAGNNFLIDFGIDRGSIPVLSYKDVLAGNFSTAAIRGKAVIVGASALELGNRLATPFDAATSGPMLQALAYESLVRDRALRGTGMPLVIFVASILALVIGPRLAAMGWLPGALAVTALSFAFYAVSIAVQARWPLMLEISPWLIVILGAYGVGLVTQVEMFSRAAFRRRMEAEQNRAVMRSVVADAPDGIVIVDWVGRIHLINRAAAVLLEVDPEAAVGMSAAIVLARLNLLPAEQGDGALLDTLADFGKAPTPAPRVMSLGAQQKRDIELFVGRTVVPRDPSGAERRVDDRIFYTLSLRDVTPHREAERAQRRAAELAMEANEAKSLFLANMSHELRTPLNAVLGFSELMTGEMFGPISPRRYLEYAQDIHSSSEHLLSVLNDILDLAKVESGRQEVDPEPFRIDGVFEECLLIVRGRNRHLRRIIETSLPDEPLILRADRRLILQSVLNLVTNAVKFSDEDGRITLRCYRDGIGDAVIEVEDNGWGISPEDLKSVARPFFQAQNSKRPDGAGTGLGLSLVARYVELHGGVMKIDSELGVGTLVRIVLPSSLVEVQPIRLVASDDA